MRKLAHLAAIVAVAALSVWLFLDETNHKPGELRPVHQQSGLACMDCHDAWKGVAQANCKQCHQFAFAAELDPRIRFHAAGDNCLSCHTEHKGPEAATSMDHTLLHPNLACSRCHLDPHEELFGEHCRDCHAISTWRVAGYRHPSRENGQCAKCHNPPMSHRDDAFWKRIQQRHYKRAGENIPEPASCSECHVTHDWRHLMM